MFKKRFLVLFILLIGLITLAGCTEDTSSNNNDNSKESDGNTTAQVDTDALEKGKYDQEITLTTVRGLDPSVTFKWEETIEDNVHTKWAKERLGINLEYLWTTTTQNNAFETKLRLALSANEEMPDILPVRDIALANDLIDSGKFMRVDELFEKYASDMYKKAVEEDPTMWYPFMREDGAYAIPIPDYSYNNDTILFIRQDWMDKLGLEEPKTLEDVEKIMDAFVNEDPDGNGEKDTYGAAVGFNESFKGNMANTSWIFGAHGTIPEQWNLAEDGSLEYGSTNPGAKKALQTLNSWMEKGYIHPEAGLHDEMKAVEIFTSGKAGIIAGPYWMDRFPLADTIENVPNAVFKQYKIPTGPEGHAGRNGTLNFSGAVLINKDIEHPEAFFVYQNYLFDHFAYPEEGSEFEYQFAEGYDYALIDGVPTYDGSQIEDGRVIPQKYTLTFEGARIPSSQMEAYSKFANGEEPSNPFEQRTFLFADELRIAGAAVSYSQRDISMREMYTGTPTKTMKSRGEHLNTLEKETFTKIIYGDLPIEEFDKFVDNWKSSGGEDIVNEVNEWYKNASR